MPGPIDGVVHMPVTVLILLALAYSSGAFFLSRPDATVRSNDHILFVGDTLVISCSVKNGLGAEVLYFTRNGKPVPRTRQRMINDNTLVYKKDNVTQNDEGMYWCKQNRSDGNSMGYAKIDVYPHLTVPDTNCKSLNFESLSCTWCSYSKNGKNWRRRWNVTYTERPMNCLSCHALSGKCKCNSSDVIVLKPAVSCTPVTIDSKVFKRGSDYIFKVTTYYFKLDRFGPLYSEHLIDPALYVKPNNVTGIRVDDIESRYVLLSWSHPERLQPSAIMLFYEIKVSGKETITTNQTHCNITSLLPFTNYSVTVRARPLFGGYWSDRERMNFTTAESAPNSPPIIFSGSYRWRPCQGSGPCTELTLFWKNIPLNDQNGQIVNCTVSVHEMSSNVTLSRDAVACPDHSSYRVILRHGQYYKIGLAVFTKVGSSPTVYWYINTTEALGYPRKIVGETGDAQSVHFKWRSPDGSSDVIKRYTVYQCDESSTHNNLCYGIQTWIVPANETEVVIVTDHDPLRYKYAISADSAFGSSGMTPEWICIYDNNRVPPPVRFIASRIQHERRLCLVWPKLSCNKDQPYGRPYTIHVFYCQSNKCNETGEHLTTSGDANETSLTVRPYTNYTVTIFASGKSGNGATVWGVFLTDESVPSGPPTELNNTEVTATSLRIHWQPPREPNGVITGYDVTVEKSGHREFKIHTRHLWAVIPNLHGHTWYNVSVKAVNSKGTSVASEPLTIRTLSGVPSVVHEGPMDVLNVSPGQTIIRLSWLPPRYPNGPLKSYQIQVHARSQLVAQKTVEAPKVSTEIPIQCRANLTDTFVHLELTALGVSGQRSKPSITREVKVCDYKEAVPVWVMPVAIVGSFVLVTFVCLCTWYCGRRTRKWFHLKVVMPPQVDWEVVTAQLYKTNDQHMTMWDTKGVFIYQEDPSAFNFTGPKKDSKLSDVTAERGVVTSKTGSCDRYNPSRPEVGNNDNELFADDEASSITYCLDVYRLTEDVELNGLDKTKGTIETCLSDTGTCLGSSIGSVDNSDCPNKELILGDYSGSGNGYCRTVMGPTF